MKKYIGFIILLAGLALALPSCNKDEIDDGSIFDTSAPERNEFDRWLLKNYVNPYNIEVKYKWEDIESDMSYDLVPARMEQSEKLAQIIKYVWLEAYDEVAGIDFMRTYVPKQILLVGSAAWDADTQTSMLGTAEGGLKIILYNVNDLDRYIDNIDALNEFYFHTMHHEFSHILHQTRPYSTDFQTITESDYVGAQWSEQADTTAHRLGFVTPYAMDQPDEDLAEIISTYITNDQADCGLVLAIQAKSGCADAVKTELEAYKEAASSNLYAEFADKVAKAQDARIVVNGDFVVMVIGSLNGPDYSEIDAAIDSALA